ncbi:MAG: dihydrofolate reductase [Tannerella sp.]|jgi:dihydrofolate reductase|nr:dihydrofolate reductase [Tannerella sp.]
MLSIIVALGEKNEIGCRNRLPWHLPADLKRFKELTTGHAIVMGRKTYESLPNGALPNRKNIVLSRNPDFSCPDCRVFSSLPEALIKLSGETEVFIIGGSQLFSQALPLVDKLYLTRIHSEFPEADTFFPEIDESGWIKCSEIAHSVDEKNCYSFTFYEYKKKENI